MTHPSTSPVVAITGAAGALGQAVVELFLGQGARVALFDRDEARLRKLYAGRADAAPHLLLGADISDEASVHAAMQRLAGHFGRLDVLVHVAGGFEMGEAVHQVTRASWERMMNLNAWSFVSLARDAVPMMLAQGGGKLIAVSAAGAAKGAAQMAAYSASKSALQRLVESLSQEVREKGINVNSIAPTIMDTPANRQAMPDADRSAWVPLAVAAQAIAFLASEAGSAVHGQHLKLGA
ncbi:MAG TPA: SDR family oxidoreductase [Ideonella sp.]|nr:SDR family oxidoreductase [Ideonella sp.]